MGVKRFVFLVPVFLLLISLTNSKVHDVSYEKQKALILQEQKKLRDRWPDLKTAREEEILLDKTGPVVQAMLKDKIFPYWYGTAWDFNGYTALPGEGSIACGYFVSTTLLHAGFRLNRYKLAQQHALSIVKTLSCGNPVYSYATDRDGFVQKAKAHLPDGLYVIGLDFHIGFFLKESNGLYFIHANFRDPAKVLMEKADTSKALQMSRNFLLTSISGNRGLLKKWVLGEAIAVI